MRLEAKEMNQTFNERYTYTILKYYKEVFHIKVINIFNCQHVGISMINLNT